MNSTINKNELRNFGLIVGTLIPLLLGFFLPYLFGHHYRYWTLLIGFPLIILGFIAPKKLQVFYFLWIKIGNLLGFVNSKIILAAIFILIVQPIAFFMKVVGYDPLRRKHNLSTSYREFRKNDKIDLEKIF